MYDETAYVGMAQNLGAGHLPYAETTSTTYTPLLPTYLLGRDFVNRRVGLMAAGLLAVSPLFIDFSSRVYSESIG